MKNLILTLIPFFLMASFALSQDSEGYTLKIEFKERVQVVIEQPEADSLSYYLLFDGTGVFTTVYSTEICYWLFTENERIPFDLPAPNWPGKRVITFEELKANNFKL